MLLMSQAGTTSPFPNQIHCIPMGKLKYLQRVKVAYFGMHCALYNNCHFRNEANHNFLALGFDFYQEASN